MNHSELQKERKIQKEKERAEKIQMVPRMEHHWARWMVLKIPMVMLR